MFHFCMHDFIKNSMLHITIACYFPTPNLIYTPILKAQALNLTLFLKAQALNLAPFLKAQALNLTLFLKVQALNLAPFLKAQALNMASFLKAQALNLAPFLKAQALNLAPFLKAQALNLVPFLKAQALNLALTPFNYLIFKHKLSKIQIKTTNNLIIKELRNPNSLSLIEIRRSEVESLSGSPLN